MPWCVVMRLGGASAVSVPCRHAKRETPLQNQSVATSAAAACMHAVHGTERGSSLSIVNMNAVRSLCVACEWSAKTQVLLSLCIVMGAHAGLCADARVATTT